MLKVIAFGEALVDMLSNRVEGGQGETLETFSKYAGGAPANVAAAVGKLGGDSYMVGKIGADMFGEFLLNSLDSMGVKTEYLQTSSQANTALAFVSLDENGERSFTFYRNPSADMLFKAEDFSESWFQSPGIFHFCSNTLTETPIREATMAGIKMAKAADYLISFDINLRSNLWRADEDPMSPIWAGLEQADLVKLCTQEMAFLCREQSEAEVLERLFSAGASLILITDGSKPLRYYSRELSGVIQPPEVNMVDSTAGGDAFMGGFLFQLAQRNCGVHNLGQLLADRLALEEALTFACHCGAHAVSYKGAFTSLPSRRDLPV